jgi:O-antigen/teichoic acid export membrane protein
VIPPQLLGVARSAVWIAGIQALNFLVPLAAVPFILRGIGVEGFSRYAVLMAFATVLVIFADFSFNVTGPIRARAALAEGRLAALLADSLVLKALLLLPGALVFLLAAGAGGDALLALGHALALALTPRWLVYSLGRLRPFALLSGASRLGWLAAVVAGAAGDLLWLLAATAAAQAVTMAGSFVLVWPGRAGPSLRRAARLFVADLGQFGAILAAAGGRELTLLILAALAAAPEVASYALADRVRVLMVGLVAPVTQALYLAIVEGAGVAAFRGPASLLVLLAAGLGGAIVFALAGPIVLALGAGELPGAVPVLRILCLLPFLTGLTAILGPNTLLAEGRGRAFAASQVAVALVGVPLAVVAIAAGGAIGAAWGAVLVEAALAAAYALALRRAGLLGRVLR